MHPAEITRLWDSISHLLSSCGTVLIIGNTQGSTAIGAEGLARGRRVLHWGTNEDSVEHFHEYRHWYTVDVCIISDIRDPSNDKIPQHATVVDTACQPWETFGHDINDYHCRDGHTLSSMWHQQHNHHVQHLPKTETPMSQTLH